jgi:hypothetical protein
MAGVTIDIPGIGNVEAKNAATEATLREILKVMQGVQKNTGGGGGGGGGAGGGAGGGGGGGGGGAGGGAVLSLTKTFGFLNRTAGAATGMLAKTAMGGMTVAKKFVDIGVASTNLIEELANVGDSLTAAASTMKNIPVVGGVLAAVFGAVAGAVEKTTAAYQSSAAAGASFGGSIGSFAKAASEAGMTMSDFGGFIKANGSAMLAFGQSTESGAKNFTRVSKELRSTSNDLYALGYSSKDINQGLANYGELLRIQGRQGNKSSAELAAGAKNYLKEMDGLAKITGEERSAKEAQAKQLAQDAQFQAATANMDEKAAASFRNTVLGLPAPLQGFVKDFLATGTLTTEETQRIGAVMGGSVMNELQNMRNKMLAGQTLSAEEQDRFRQILAASGKKAQKDLSSTFAATREFDGAMQAVTASAGLNTSANKDAAKAQANAAANTDAQNKAAEEAKQQLAALSNSFMMVLAQSGLLSTMMTVFQGLATVVQTVVVPIFQALASGIQTAVGVFANIFGGDSMKNSFGKIIETAKQLLTTVADFFGQLLVAVDWQGIMTMVVDVGTSVMSAVNNVLNAVKPVFMQMIEVGQNLFSKLGPVITNIADIISIIATNLAPILGPIVDSIGQVLGGFFDMIGGIVKIVKGLLTGDFSMVGEGLKDVFTGFVDRITGLIKTIWEIIKSPVSFVKNLMKSDAEKEAEAAAAVKEATEKKLQAAQEKAAKGDSSELDRIKRVEKQQEEYKKAKEKEAVAEKKKAEVAKETTKAAEAASINYTSGSEQLLKQMAIKEGSAFVPKAPSAASAETTKKEIEQKGQDKAAAEKKAADEAEAKKKAEETSKEKQEQDKKTQDSPSTLLAELNTKMATLLQYTFTVAHNTNENVTATRGLNGNLMKR